MAASSLADLFEFESHLEAPLANWFSNANTSWQVLTPRTLANVALGTDFLRTPRVLIEFHVTGIEDLRETSAGATSNGVQYYATRNGQVALTIVTQRANTTQNSGLMRGTARQAMLEATQIWNSNNLPFYQVADVSESGSTQSPNPDNDEIMTQLTFATKFWINPAMFP